MISFSSDGIITTSFLCKNVSSFLINSAFPYLSYGTDCPVEDCNPFPNIYMAVTRKDRQGRPAGGFYPGECVDVETAIDAYTKESAYAEFQEDVKGRLMPGYYADMVLLDRDIFTVDPMEIKDILPVMTIVGGKVVYKK